jgi:YHS domain-containing protein
LGVRDYPALYRDRIYYLTNEEEREKFLKEPSKYTKGIEACPSDV